MNRKICEFYVVDSPTAILGIHNSESLKLITVHFVSIDTETSQAESVPRQRPTPTYVNAIQGDDDEFTVKIKCEYMNTMNCP